ncbi:CHAT domain-containing protein [Saccharothrix variisporea]|uniref:CHAT domain-containing protein n=1 Tax=Saccharothrix variisporea TaxID=543527 RepID=A0A495XC91_9PSEU|nr:CHAT domain-containing protein [Saccharothrix variisporea]RKT70906.1 CHAT domain-containing protein [Saccharothrix variisporea]
MGIEDVLARCRATVDRVAGGGAGGLSGTSGVGGAELSSFVVDLTGLPADHPERSRLAVTMVMALTKGGGFAPVEVAGHLDDLLGLVDHVPATLAVWPQVRASARAQSLMHAAANDLPIDLAAAERELVELEERMWDVPAVKLVVEGAKRVVVMIAAGRVGDERAMGKAFDALHPWLDRMGDDPNATTMRSLGDTAQRAMAAQRAGDLDEAIRLIGEMKAAAANLPAEVRQVFAGAFDDFDAFSTATRGGAPEGGGPVEDAERAVRSLDDQGAPVQERVKARLILFAALTRGGEETDLTRIDAAVDHLRTALGLGPDRSQLEFVLTGLAVALFRRSEISGSTEGLDEAEQHLVRALDLMGGPQHPQWALASGLLSNIRQRLGDLAGAGEFGRAAQRSYAWRALLEPDPAEARVAIRDAVRDATELARTCLRANNIADALRALDTCRGLMLFAEVELRDVPAKLVAAGRADLAGRWVREGRDSEGLRREVVAALVDAGATRNLLDPPDLAEVRRALADADADALVYLLPGDGVTPGAAVIAPRTGNPAYMVLPHLVVEGDADVERYLEALAHRSREAEGATREIAPDGGGSFGDSVAALCDWAWRAAMGPLLERYFARTAAGRVPRVVLVPMGDLARVPWQAARRADGTYAVQLAAFSQAVSARLFCDNAARRPVSPGSTGLVVGDPDTAGAAVPLDAARVEAHAIRQSFYRSARYVGRRPDGSTSPSGRGTAAEVREWLADTAPQAGTTLHLACHGSYTAKDGKVKAALLLAPDDDEPGELDTDEIVRVLRAVPERRIGLVVMAACHTGRSVHGYDEAYSLGTAFLAGGVRTVLSTNWAIPDQSTSALMYLFHHHLRVDGMPPWQALRAAQMWMLDPDRVPPPGMPERLRSVTADHDHAHVVAWAGFVHGGQ